MPPDEHWIRVDVEPGRGDLLLDFQGFDRFPFPDGSVECIYGSHVFEHISIYRSQRVFEECARVLRPAGVMRMVPPDVRKSIDSYLAADWSFDLFRRRRARATAQWGIENYTLFDCLREDFLSRSAQARLGSNALAHQNAWDFETLERDLRAAGFTTVARSSFQGSHHEFFAFEGTYPSEANESDRSIYVETTM